MSNKTTILAVFGTILEVYDFLIYSLLASYLAKIFFIEHSSYITFIETFIVFSVGYLIRPIGGIIIASIGDRFGRKPSFLISIQLMAISTLLISCLPTYQSIGVFSPLLLMILRILQGFSHGGELPGALTFVAEGTGEKRRGYHTGLIFFGTGLGAILGTTVMFILTKKFTEQEILKFYWRIPFLIGGVLSLVGIYFRHKISETPVFEKILVKELKPFKTTMQNHIDLVAKGFFISLLPTLLIVLGHYLPAYFQEFQDFPDDDIYFAMLCGTIVFTFSVLGFSFISDFFKKTNLIYLNIIITLFFSCFLLVRPGIHSVLIFIIVYKLISGMFFACFPCLLVELFPTEIRYTGVAFCYNIAFFSSTLLLLFTTFCSRIFGNPSFTVGLIGLVSVMSLLLLYFYPLDKRNFGFIK